MEENVAWWAFFLWSAVIIIGLTVFCYIVTRNLQPVPGRMQNILEFIVERLNAFVVSIIGHGGEKHTPFVGTLFVFIFLNNLIGIVPGALSPTSNLSTTIALALVTFLYVQIEGIKAHGIVGRLRHLAGPIPALAPLMFPIEVIGELARPLSLSIRLYGNIFGEDRVIIILAGLAYYIIPRYVAIPYQFPMLIFGVFTSFVQALVFAMLAAVYISLTAGETEH